MKRPSSIWSSIAMLAATAAGWALGMFTVPVPSLIWLVAGQSRREADAGRDVLRLVGHMLADIALGESQFIREQERSRSSVRDWRQSLSRGWIGIVKKPRFIAHRHAFAARPRVSIV